MRWLFLAALATVLSGCGLPPAVTVVSLVADVFSYAATGKSVTDHGISIVLQKDCALLRGFEGDICIEPDPAAEFASSLAFATDPVVILLPAGRASDEWLAELGYLGDSLDRAG
ncbi:MAG: hypothetical protein ACTSQ7_13340 [Alphaproteobacteria bacterium]